MCDVAIYVQVVGRGISRTSQNSAAHSLHQPLNTRQGPGLRPWKKTGKAQWERQSRALADPAVRDLDTAMLWHEAAGPEDELERSKGCTNLSHFLEGNAVTQASPAARGTAYQPHAALQAGTRPCPALIPGCGRSSAGTERVSCVPGATCSASWEDGSS